ncbi:primosomal protein N' [Candidatus Methylopumilus planktonicus]|uniref:primosomal protein N' n=1 Tax=Candidatus Methylopumilus planktonicus TaxID=1581557 RepID=UPI003D18AEA0
MTDTLHILKVALDVPLDRVFDYRTDKPNTQIGQYVVVPFGARKMIGVVVGISDTTAIESKKLKSIIRLDPEVIFDEQSFKLFQFCSQYYHYPLGQTILSAVPSRLKKLNTKAMAKKYLYRLTPKAIELGVDSLPSRQTILKRIVMALIDATLLDEASLRSMSSAWKKSIETLDEMGWIEKEEVTLDDKVYTQAPIPSLNDEQQKAFDEISKTNKTFAAWLLYGITGSGKTEVYIRLIEEALKKEDAQVLVLVPEINLTPQLESRFRSRFEKYTLVTLHSHLTDNERLTHWRLAKEGAAQIIIGTRLSVFTPMPHLSLIIIDEEHDASFKQQEGLRYHARDVAIFRAKSENIPIVMGTATPSLESWFNATRTKDTKKFGFLKLTSRAVEDSSLPEIKCIDIAKSTVTKGFSPYLIEAIRDRLHKKEQSLIFINRRGFAPVLLCSSCQWTGRCHRCSSRLVVHLNQKRLRCHHCGHDEKMPLQCPSCGNTDLYPTGLGTQRIEETLKEFFPEARILRVDRDSTKTKEALNDLFLKMKNREIDILIGTQMLSKGHDFPHLSLVGVLDTDQALYSPDFRASERLFSQLMQVSGRAGRATIKGEVYIQTAFPNHPIFEALKTHDYENFANELLKERELAELSPFAFLVLLKAEAHQLAHVMQFLNDAMINAQNLSAHVTVYNPVRPIMERLKGMERAQLVLQASSRIALQKLLDDWVPYLRENKLAQKVKWVLDIDPLEF